MNCFFVYIIYSEKIDRFYIGSTSLIPNERLARHLSKFYGSNKFTAVTDDWVIFYSLECCSRKQALAVESHIKRMKSKAYIKNLLNYPDISKKLLEKYDIDC